MGVSCSGVVGVVAGRRLDMGGKPPELHGVANDLKMPAVLAHDSLCLNIACLECEKLRALWAKRRANRAIGGTTDKVFASTPQTFHHLSLHERD